MYIYVCVCACIHIYILEAQYRRGDQAARTLPRRRHSCRGMYIYIHVYTYFLYIHVYTYVHTFYIHHNTGGEINLRGLCLAATILAASHRRVLGRVLPFKFHNCGVAPGIIRLREQEKGSGLYICIDTFVSIYLSISIAINLTIYLYIYIYIYISIYVYIYTHTYIYRKTNQRNMDTAIDTQVG